MLLGKTSTLSSHCLTQIKQFLPNKRMYHWSHQHVQASTVTVSYYYTISKLACQDSLTIKRQQYSKTRHRQLFFFSLMGILEMNYLLSRHFLEVTLIPKTVFFFFWTNFESVQLLHKTIATRVIPLASVPFSTEPLIHRIINSTLTRQNTITLKSSFSRTDHDLLSSDFNLHKLKWEISISHYHTPLVK